MLVTGAKKTQKVILNQISYIYFLMQFQIDKEATIWALIDLSSNVNIMTLAYAKRLSF